MNKAELSKLLEEKVSDKLKDGYEILNYAMDAASRDKLKRDLKVHGRNVPHEDGKEDEWRNYLWQVERGIYQGRLGPNRFRLKLFRPYSQQAPERQPHPAQDCGRRGAIKRLEALQR